ncbi:unnamed protein product [Rhizoctonia solani]|uniref:Uncharacterized protein n=1 Tax=Rhizoctonia solani TaxID=456999 RepID=A0A8H2X5E7_9AGAM|nr:unnamed protein product [Rhizoctonia solani]
MVARIFDMMDRKFDKLAASDSSRSLCRQYLCRYLHRHIQQYPSVCWHYRSINLSIIGVSDVESELWKTGARRTAAIIVAGRLASTGNHSEDHFVDNSLANLNTTANFGDDSGAVRDFSFPEPSPGDVSAGSAVLRSGL